MSYDMAVSDQSFGELLGAFNALKDDVAEIKADNKEAFKAIKEENKAIITVLDGIKGRFDRIDGGWKALMFMAGIAGTVGAAVTAIAIKAWPFLIGTLPKI